MPRCTAGPFVFIGSYHSTNNMQFDGRDAATLHIIHIRNESFFIWWYNMQGQQQNIALATGCVAHEHITTTIAYCSWPAGRRTLCGLCWLDRIRFASAPSIFWSPRPTFIFKDAYYFSTPFGMTSFKGNHRDSNLRRRFHRFMTKTLSFMNSRYKTAHCL